MWVERYLHVIQCPRCRGHRAGEQRRPAPFLESLVADLEPWSVKEADSVEIVVQKFGGTSLVGPDAQRLAVERVRELKAGGLAPVVVVSALGRRGMPYATDTLLDLLPPATPARERDLAAACGEQLSAAWFAGALAADGIPARGLTGGQAGIITDGHFGCAHISRVDPQPVRNLLNQGVVPVVAGFQGVDPTGEITTLGRGGSDLTAVALGVALGAVRVDIMTDVDGVMTADPKVVPDARTLAQTTYAELSQLAWGGARVMHPRSVDLAMRYGLVLRVRSTSGAGAGTLVTPALQAQGVCETNSPVTAIAHRTGLTQLVVTASGRSDDTSIFAALSEAGISVDMINLLDTAKVFTVADEDGQRAGTILDRLGFSYRARPGCAKVCSVGLRMLEVPGVMARIMRALDAAGVPILQTSDSNTTISCLVPGELVLTAVRALHEHFQLGRMNDGIWQVADGNGDSVHRAPRVGP
jgi:aspartate kinase